MDEDDLIRETMQQFMEAKDEFCQAHKAGMDALERGDYEAVSRAITAEYNAIEKQRTASRRLEKTRAALRTESR